jgi:anti-sigma regulatory factor (Ser/Thr protein kinase)
LPLEARKIGGLGLHLIKRMARDVSYDYKDKNSTITIKMGLED